MAKKALVLGGGGAKGSYEMGAWKAFDELGKTWDIITGTSIGSLNGAVIAEGDFQKAEYLWKNIDFEKLFHEDEENVPRIESTLDIVKFCVSDMINEGSYDTKELYETIKLCIDEEKVRNSSARFGLMTVEIPNMKPWGMMIDDIPNGKLCDFLLASCSCFPVFKPWKIENRRFIDGGYYDNLPVNLAIDNGAEDIVAVDLEAVGFNKTTKKEEYPILKIKPYWNLGSLLEFELTRYERNKALGYNDTMKAYGFMEGMFFSFKKGEGNINFKRLKNHVGKAEKTVNEMLLRPVSRAVQTIDSKSVSGFLSEGSFLRNPTDMLTRIAEMAGIVFKISPVKVYSFKEYNDILLEQYLKFGGTLENIRSLDIEISGILSAIGRALDNRSIATLMVQMILKENELSESMWTLAEIMPREFASAVYISMLIDSKGILPQ